jgi:hypothetical protein
MKDDNVRKWCRLFKGGRTNMHDEESSGRSNSSSWKFSNILHIVPNLTPNNRHLFLHLKKFWAGQNLRTDNRQKSCARMVESGWRPRLTKAYKSWSYCTKSAPIYMATVWRRHHPVAIINFYKLFKRFSHPYVS